MAKRQKLERWWDVTVLQLPNPCEIQLQKPRECTEFELKLTYTHIQTNDEPLAYPDGFAVLDQGEEVGRLPCDVLSLCRRHPCCVEALPSFFRLAWRTASPGITVQVELVELERALEGPPRSIQAANRVMPLLMHQLVINPYCKLGQVSGAARIRCFPHLLHKSQRSLVQSLRQISDQPITEHPPFQLSKIGDSDYWADLHQQRIVQHPNTEPCKLTCRGGLIWSPRGAGLKRAILAHLFSSSAKHDPTLQERELYFCSDTLVCVICNKSKISGWQQEANALGINTLVIKGYTAWKASTMAQLQAAQLCIVSQHLLLDLRFWATDPSLLEWETVGIPRGEIMMHLQRSPNRLAAQRPLLDLVRWRGVVFADPIKASIARRMVAAERWLLLHSEREPNLMIMHRAFKVLRAESSGPPNFAHLANKHGLAWTPPMPMLQKFKAIVPLEANAQAWCLEHYYLDKESLLEEILISKTRGHLMTSEAAIQAVLNSNAAQVGRLEQCLQRLRKELSSLHAELENEQPPDGWDDAVDWETVREQVLQEELDRVEAEATLAKHQIKALRAVQREHLQASLTSDCPVCLDRPSNVLCRCGHGLCWLCARHLLAEQSAGDQAAHCPQCRMLLRISDLWMTGTPTARPVGSGKIQHLGELIKSIKPEPTLILVNTVAASRALRKAISPPIKHIHQESALSAPLCIGCAGELTHCHLPVKHLILMHSSMLNSDHLLLHAGQPLDSKLRITTLCYEGLED